MIKTVLKLIYSPKKWKKMKRLGDKKQKSFVKEETDLSKQQRRRERENYSEFLRDTDREKMKA